MRRQPATIICDAARSRASHRHRRRRAIGTMSPAITATTAVQPPMAASASSKTAAARAPVSSISAVSELSSLFARKSKSKSKPKFKLKFKSMTAVVAAKLLLLFLPFLFAVRKRRDGEDALSGDEHPGRAAERQRLRRRAALGRGHADIRRFGVGANPVAADGLDGKPETRQPITRPK